MADRCIFECICPDVTFLLCGNTLQVLDTRQTLNLLFILLIGRMCMKNVMLYDGQCTALCNYQCNNLS